MMAVPKVSMATPLHRRGLGAGRQWSGESTASVGPAAENRPKVTDAWKCDRDSGQLVASSRLHSVFLPSVAAEQFPKSH